MGGGGGGEGAAFCVDTKGLISSMSISVVLECSVTPLSHLLYTPTSSTHPPPLHTHLLYTPTSSTHPPPLHTHLLYTPTSSTHPPPLHTHLLYTPTSSTHPPPLHTHLLTHTPADCNEKFSTESEYNEHLNSHMNFEHRCPYKDCGQTFSVFKRLDIHCKMAHHTTVEEARSKSLPV